MTRVLQAGVIGAGVFGGYHAKQYAKQPGVRLAAVFDLDPARAEALAEPLEARAYDDMAEFLAAVEVVTVATPAIGHAEAALAALRAGKPVYVEKPLAVDPADGARLVGEASSRALTLACGHQERVVFLAMGLLDIIEQPISLHSVRRGTPSPRNRDVGVGLDLMIHDIDLALALARGPAEAIAGQGNADTLTARARFAGGFEATLEASRVAEQRERTMRLVYPSGEVEIDFLARTFRNTTPHPLAEDFADTPAGRDPLGASVAGFLAAVAGRAPRPVVTGEEALAALEFALAAERAAGDLNPG